MVEQLPPPENESEKKRYKSRRVNGIQQFLVADPNGTEIEPASGETYRPVTDDEQQEAIRLLAARDPDAPQVWNDQAPESPFDARKRDTGQLINNLIDLTDDERIGFHDTLSRARDEAGVDAVRADATRTASERRAQNAVNTPQQPPHTPPNVPPPIPPGPFIPSPPSLPGTLPGVVPRGSRSSGGGSGTIRPMGGLDAFYKRRARSAELDRKKTLVNPVSGETMEEDVDMTIGELMGDKEQQRMFIGKFLHRADPAFAETVGQKIADGTLLDDKEDKLLEKYRKQYLKERNEAENVKEFLTPEMYQKIADADPRIGQIVGKIGMERAEEIIDAELMELMIADPKAFRKMRDNLKRVYEADNSELTKTTEKGIQHYLGKLQIGEDEFLEATKLGNPIDVERRFNELANEKFPLYLRAINFGNWITHRKAHELRLHYENGEEIMRDVTTHMKSVGSVLHATVTPEVKLRIQKLAMDGIAEAKQPDTVSTIEEYRAVKHENSDATIQKGFEAYRDAEAAKHKITDWTTGGNPAKLDALKDTYAKAVYDKQQKHKTSGLYAALLRLLFGLNTSSDDIKNKLH